MATDQTHSRNWTFKILQPTRFASLQSAQEIAPHVLHTGLDFPLRLCTIRPAQPGSESPIAGKSRNTGFQTVSPRSSVSCHTVFIAVVQNFFRTLSRLYALYAINGGNPVTYRPSTDMLTCEVAEPPRYTVWVAF